MRVTYISLMIVFTMCLAGCKQADSNKPADAKIKAEGDVKQAFASLQAAIKAKDVDKIWDLIDADTRADCQRYAKEIKEAHAKAADKDALPKKLSLTPKEVSEMTAKLYVKSKAFFDGETDEMPGSKVDKVVVTGENTAKIHYTDEKDKEVRSVVLEDGKWRFNLPNPGPKLKDVK